MFTLKMPYTSWSHLLLCARKFRKNNYMSYGEILSCQPGVWLLKKGKYFICLQSLWFRKRPLIEIFLNLEKKSGSICGS